MIYLILALLIASFVGGVVLANRVLAAVKSLHARFDVLEEAVKAKLP